MDTPSSRRPLVLAVLCAAIALPTESGEPDFVAWARTRAVPIDASGKAFRSLDPQIKHARLIGMGESVHESEPFLSFRVEFLKDLIRRHRVTALIFESGLAEAMALDEYVLGRSATVDYVAALPGGFANLKEIRSAMEWIREWNRGPGRSRPVHTYGADVPARQASMVPALDRLQELTADRPDIKPLIEALRPAAVQAGTSWFRTAQEKYDAVPADVRSAWTRDVDRLVLEVGLLKGGDADRLEWARRVALVAQQYEAMQRLGGFSPTAPRDKAMADNTMWILGRLGRGERAVYWAHNAHVQRVPVAGPSLPPGRFPPTGMRLAAALGPKYVAVGTAYGGPSRDDGSAVAADSIDAAFGSVAAGPFLLPIRAKAPSGVASWLAEERAMRFQAKHLMVALGPAFDAIAYFEGASAAARVKN